MVPGGWEWLIIIAVLLLLFGAKRLPDMARSIGQSARVFKGEMKGLKSDEEAGKAGKADEQASGQTDKADDAPAALPPVADAPQGAQGATNGTRTTPPSSGAK
ncbi:Sec-independent protein translocase subunit TatA [Pseudonocardia zijingensis]|uniref:Sec-independent protein translocase protein TatA n=1 Tax=Pseudonocardia zijingensis TaxID=153376 RepID=A0ABN1QFM7_9PSEU